MTPESIFRIGFELARIVFLLALLV